MVLSTNAAIKRLNLESCRIRDAGVEAAKGCRGEGSRDLTWVRLVVGCNPLTLLGKLCDVFCDRSLFLSQHNSPGPCVKQDVIFMLHARCQYTTFYQINVLHVSIVYRINLSI